MDTPWVICSIRAKVIGEVNDSNYYHEERPFLIFFNNTENRLINNSQIMIPPRKKVMCYTSP